VLSDVAAVLGPDSVAVVFPDELDTPYVRFLVDADPDLLDRFTRSSATEGWVFIPGEPSSVGLSDWNHPPFADLVERAANIVQEVIMESRRHRGAAFPPCPEHPNTPLWSAMVDGEAVWRCIDGGTTVVRVGSIAGERNERAR